MPRVLFTICGRAGSKGIAGKNAGAFLGIPLVNYTIAAIELYREANPDVAASVALNTDSELLRDVVASTGISFINAERVPELATDSASKIDVIASTLEQAEVMADSSFDLVVDLDITSPLRVVNDIEHVIGLASQGLADVVFTVTKSRRNPCFNMVLKGEDGYYRRVLDSKFTSRQQAPEFFDMNASIYAYNPDFLRSGKQIFDGRCVIVEMRDTAVLDLDNPDDLDMMQIIAQWLIANDTAFARIVERAKELSGAM